MSIDLNEEKALQKAFDEVAALRTSLENAIKSRDQLIYSIAERHRVREQKEATVMVARNERKPFNNNANFPPYNE